MVRSIVAQRRPPSYDREGDPPRGPRLVPPLEPAPQRSKRKRDVALDVQGSLAIPDGPLPWERELLSAYLAILLEGPGLDDEHGPGA